MPKVTEEPTNNDANGNQRPGGVDLRTDLTKEKTRTTTEANLKYLDENVESRNRYSASNPHLGEPYSSLQTLAFQALRRYGDMHPGTVDGEVIMMFVEFANLVLEDLRAHPYFDNIDVRRHLIEIEEVLIKAAIEKNSGHITKASECLKLNRTTLIEKMKKLSIN